MTIPYERTRALVYTYDFLNRLLDGQQTPRVPPAVRAEARALLRHYPTFGNIETAHRALPHLFESVEPFLREGAGAQRPSDDPEPQG